MCACGKACEGGDVEGPGRWGLVRRCEFWGG